MTVGADFRTVAPGVQKVGSIAVSLIKLEIIFINLQKQKVSVGAPGGERNRLGGALPLVEEVSGLRVPAAGDRTWWAAGLFLFGHFAEKLISLQKYVSN